YTTRLLAEAQIKTDRLDAQMLAKVLRGDLIAQSHAPSAATRARKHSFTAAALLGPATHDVAQSDARDFGSTTRARAAAIEKLFQPARPNLVGRGAVALCRGSALAQAGFRSGRAFGREDQTTRSLHWPKSE